MSYRGISSLCSPGGVRVDSSFGYFPDFADGHTHRRMWDFRRHLRVIYGNGQLLQIFTEILNSRRTLDLLVFLIEHPVFSICDSLLKPLKSLCNPIYDGCCNEKENISSKKKFLYQ